MKKENLEKKVEEEKAILERKIKETIRILGCTHPNDLEQLSKYQKALKDYAKEWADKYETDFKHYKY